MAINRTELLEDVKIRMRSDNKFTDTQMNKFIDLVITSVGDDDINYIEVLCKSLREIAENNELVETRSGGIKSRKIEDVIEESYYKEDDSGTWEDYLNKLPKVCARMGYSGLDSATLGMIHVNNAEDESVDDDFFIEINPVSTCPNSSTSTTDSSIFGYPL